MVCGFDWFKKTRTVGKIRFICHKAFQNMFENGMSYLEKKKSKTFSLIWFKNCVETGFFDKQRSKQNMKEGETI